jgi:signal transduction histidine kinase
VRAATQRRHRFVRKRASTATPRRALSSVDRLDLAIVAAVALLAVGSGWAILPPETRPQLVAPGLDVSFETITTLVTAGVVCLAWLVYREVAEPQALYQASAFLVLAAANMSALVVATLVLQGATEGPAGPDAAVYIFTAARSLAAALLALGGLAGLAARPKPRPAVVLTVPLLALLAVVAVVAVLGTSLPALVVAAPAALPSGRTPEATTLGALVQLPAALLFLWAAASTRTLYARTRRAADAYLAVGLLVAAFGQVHLAVYPAARPGIVTTGDLLRLVFDAALLLGVAAEARSSMRALRVANATLARLRDADVDRAALEERARVSREFHDGLAQDLWIAKLRTGRLAAQPGLGQEAAAICAEVDSALDDALAAARHAIAALRLPSPEAGGFGEMLRAYAADFGTRFGIDVEVACDDGVPELPPRVEAELVRIAQEALNNVRRHADATLVHVAVEVGAGSVTLSIVDNGRGFDPATVRGSGFGLESMRERATIAGASLAVESRPHDGTRVAVVVPLPAAPRRARYRQMGPQAAGTDLSPVPDAIA